MKLSKSEEQVMRYLWKLERGGMKELIEQYEDPKPANTTIATLLKRIKNKGFIDYIEKGRSREYFPLVAQADYFEGHFKGLLKNFFGNSAVQFASHFTRTTDLSTEELHELRKIIDQQIEMKNKER